MLFDHDQSTWRSLAPVFSMIPRSPRFMISRTIFPAWLAALIEVPRILSMGIPELSILSFLANWGPKGKNPIVGMCRREYILQSNVFERIPLYLKQVIEDIIQKIITGESLCQVFLYTPDKIKTLIYLV